MSWPEKIRGVIENRTWGVGVADGGQIKQGIAFLDKKKIKTNKNTLHFLYRQKYPGKLISREETCTWLCVIGQQRQERLAKVTGEQPRGGGRIL